MKILILINAIAFVIATIWATNSQFKPEQVIAALTLLATLVGLIIKEKNAVIKKQSVIIKGNKNKTQQNNHSQVNNGELDQKMKIEGSENESKQE